MKSFKKIICIVTLLGVQPQIKSMDWFRKRNPSDNLSDLITLSGIGSALLVGMTDKLHTNPLKKIISATGIGFGGVFLSIYLSDIYLMKGNIFSLIKDGNTRKVLLWLVLGGDINKQTKEGNTLLMGAVGFDNFAMVQLLVKRGAVLDIKNEDGLTALMLAVTKNNVPIAKYLLQKGADPFVKTAEGANLLHIAAIAGTPAMIDLLAPFMEKTKPYFIDINAKDNDGGTPLMYAALRDNWYYVKYLLDHGADATIRDNKGLTAMDWAEKQGAVESIAFLNEPKVLRIRGFEKVKTMVPQSGKAGGVENIVGSFLGVKNKNLDEQLLKAAKSGDVQTIKALKAQGTKPNVLVSKHEHRDLEGGRIHSLTWEIPLNKAIENNHPDAVKELLQDTTLSYLPQDALHEAILTNKADIVEFLLKNYSLDVEGRGSSSYLIHAVSKNFPAIVKLLLQAGANTQARDSQGQTAYELAKSLGNPEMLKIFEKFKPQNEDLNQKLFAAIRAKDLKQVDALVMQGAHIDATDDEGNSPLIIAAGNGALEIMEFLIGKIQEGLKAVAACEKKIEFVNAKNNYGTTALIWAVINNRQDAVRKLLQEGAKPTIKDAIGRDAFKHAGNNKAMVEILQKEVPLERVVQCAVQ